MSFQSSNARVLAPQPCGPAQECVKLSSWALPVSHGMWVLLWVLPGRLWVLTLLSVPEEKFSAEVESWMTGEQYAAWILSARYCQRTEAGLGVCDRLSPALRFSLFWSSG